MGRRVELWFSIGKCALYLFVLLGGSFALLLLSSAAAHAGDGQPTTTQSAAVTGRVDPASDEVLDRDDVDEREAVEQEPAAQPGGGAGESGEASRVDDAGSPSEESVSASPASSGTGGEKGGEPTRSGEADADDETVDDAAVRNVAGEPPERPAEPSSAPSDEPPEPQEHPEPQEPPEPAKPSPGEVSGDAAGGAGHAYTIDQSGNGGLGDEESDSPAAVKSPSADTRFEGAHAAGDGVRALRAGETSASEDPVIGAVEPDVVPAALELATLEPWAGPSNELGSWLAVRGLEAPTLPRAFTAASASSAAGAAWMSTAPPKVDPGSGGARNADGEGFNLDRLLRIGQHWLSILGWPSHAPVDPTVPYSLLYDDGEVTPPSPGVWDTVIVVGRGGFWAPNVFCGLVSDRPAQLCDSPHVVPERPG